MIEPLRPDDPSAVPWVTSDPRVPVPDTSMLPERDQVSSADARARSRAQAVDISTDELLAAGDAWLDRLRGTVRSRPLGSVAAALALGLVLARLAR